MEWMGQNFPAAASLAFPSAASHCEVSQNAKGLDHSANHDLDISQSKHQSSEGRIGFLPSMLDQGVIRRHMGATEDLSLSQQPSLNHVTGNATSEIPPGQALTPEKASSEMVNSDHEASSGSNGSQHGSGLHSTARLALSLSL